MLLFFGALDVVIAASLWAPDATTRAAPLYVWVAGVAPLWWWAGVWVVVGVLCLVHAFRRDDRVGWVGAVSLKLMWGALSLGGWLLGAVPRGWVSAAIWLGLAYAVSVMAGWAEPDGEKVIWTRRR
jgi:hypothetical protein